jgi:hypothetical protein
MSESYKIVISASPRGQGERHRHHPMKETPQSEPHMGEVSMPVSVTANVKPSALASNGRLLVFAPPLMMGFRGCPLALSNGKVSVKAKTGVKRNWAKRRAFGH